MTMTAEYRRIALPRRYTRVVMGAAALRNMKPINYQEKILVAAAKKVIEVGADGKPFKPITRKPGEPNLALIFSREGYDTIRTAAQIEGLNPPQFAVKYLLPKAFRDIEAGFKAIKATYDGAA
jgi:hypothetical protein